ncbi:P-loop containing nucleoside triphosphate hydrolase protein [Rhizoclosmatium globosum]|uniref:DNA helicase n=1 Tax=Rhizoclosmatium globosum TaxID=329046 RepID=A0A1Y2C348_9FUNG|nr:P-loop containing nucleoside triphosphate hydrolase protein [Rhizoclosmatium globosum]|eukprot:ORY41317.1 P-loop containing nucleoside triphosphate hydrolase protein [Rhizoclosmatium globosum]
MEIIAAHRELVLRERQLAQAEESENINNGVRMSALVRVGLAVKNARVESVRTGLGGKSIATFALGQGHSFALKVGDPVVAIGASSSTGDQERLVLRGVVSKTDTSTFSVSFSGDANVSFDSATVAKADSAATFDRMDAALKDLQNAIGFSSEKASSKHLRIGESLLNVLLHGTQPSFSTRPAKPIEFLNQMLNDSQKDAVAKCLAADAVALIHGPPGTGKTETVVELVRQLVKRGDRVLLCGPSNISVDTLAARLTPHLNPNLQFTRIGHPSRVRRDQVLTHTLDIRVRSSDEGQIANDVRAEMDATLIKIQKCKRKAERRTLYDDMKRLRAELRSRCCCYTVWLWFYVLQNEYFDAIVIDESSQAIEAESWIAILKANPKARVFLAGDHLQLPPTVKSSSPSRTPPVSTLFNSPQLTSTPTSLTQTLFDRLLSTHGPSIKSMLTIQYRMHATICKHPSKYFYNSLLPPRIRLIPPPIPPPKRPRNKRNNIPVHNLHNISRRTRGNNARRHKRPIRL